MLNRETLETLSKNANLGGAFQTLQAMDCNGKNIELSFDDGLKNEFSKVESSEGSRYERKKV